MADLPDGISQAVDEALTEIVGMHGVWVVAVENYDPESGEPRLTTIWSNDHTKWGQLGIARALLIQLEMPLSRTEED